jgi:hypothetical protein
MLSFFETLKVRNEVLYYFGVLCFVCAGVFFVLTKTSQTQVYGVSAWFKPFKFAVSLGVYSWTVAWICFYLPNFNLTLFNWTVVVAWTFELLYIGFQAGRGQVSHYNISTPVYSFLYGMMAIAASLITIYTAYIGLLFFKNEFPQLPEYYLWAIRLGIVIFVIFSFEGFAMGSRLNHSVGALNDNSNWFIVGWSQTVGDLRVAHFIGMHALQALPILSFYVLKNTRLTFVVAALYLLLAAFTLWQAAVGRPVFSVKVEKAGASNS